MGYLIWDSSVAKVCFLRVARTNDAWRLSWPKKALDKGLRRVMVENMTPSRWKEIRWRQWGYDGRIQEMKTNSIDALTPSFHLLIQHTIARINQRNLVNAGKKKMGIRHIFCWVMCKCPRIFCWASLPSMTFRASVIHICHICIKLNVQ